MENERREDEAGYITRFMSLSDAVEKRIRRAAMIAFVLLLVVQGLLLFEGARHKLTGIDRMEGRTIDFAPPT